MTQETGKQVEMENELKEREQPICVNQKISVDDIVIKLNITRRIVLRDVQEIKNKMFLMNDKKEVLWRLK